MSKNIIKVFTSGDDNLCMCIMISAEAKTKIQSLLRTKINWDDDRTCLDGVQGDINVQIPNTADAITYISVIDIYDLEFTDDAYVKEHGLSNHVSTKNEDLLHEYINQLITEAEALLIQT